MGHKTVHTERKVEKGRAERKDCDRQQRQRRKILNSVHNELYTSTTFSQKIHLEQKSKKVKHDNILNRINIFIKRHTDGK